jgi:hypothetical protein
MTVLLAARFLVGVLVYAVCIVVAQRIGYHWWQGVLAAMLLDTFAAMKTLED